MKNPIMQFIDCKIDGISETVGLRIHVTYDVFFLFLSFMSTTLPISI